jgi:hypothetical protein
LRQFAKPRVLVVIACAILMAIPAWISISTGEPQPYAPLPWLVFLPAWFIGKMLEFNGEYYILIIYLAAIVTAIFSFVALHWDTARYERVCIPLRFVILLSFATVCSAIWLSASWSYGIQYQGPNYTWTVTLINIVCIVALWSCWFAWRRNASFSKRVGFGALLHSWLFWFAFPWLGELL